MEKALDEMVLRKRMMKTTMYVEVLCLL